MSSDTDADLLIPVVGSRSVPVLRSCLGFFLDYLGTVIVQNARSALEALAARDGVSLSALSQMLGRNPAYLQQYIRRGSPRTLAEGDRRRLADFFGVAETVLGGAEPSAEQRYRLPRLDLAASAGPGAYVDAEVASGVETLDPHLARRLRLAPGAGSILRVRGTSMEPALYDGDHIVIDRHDRQPARQPAIFVIRIGETLMVKRVSLEGGRLVIRSDHPDAPPVPDGEVGVIGRVVWQMRAWR